MKCSFRSAVTSFLSLGFAMITSLAIVGCGGENGEGEKIAAPSKLRLVSTSGAEASDSFTLELLAGGTLNAKIFGCDFSSEWEGEWLANETEVVLLPHGKGQGERWREGICTGSCLLWFNDVGATPTTEVHFVKGSEPEQWQATFHDLIFEKDVEQVWNEGWVTHTCGPGSGG